ncbi:ribbon-helix-helix protein, CopG family [Thiomicrospira microaerophila]|uniref:ribbon-helix-helix protein, CopG family n=1 Tax=Thiomicrospira microaerophila TaxID=406020 RepID=UPI0005C91AEE|nr:ribbon-helix-helix protein, CopG family [Thiomicrospira microaerophila]
MKKAINIRMDVNLLSELDGYAEELERSRTYLIEKAVSTYVDTLDEMLADKRIDALKSGQSTVVSMEDVFKNAGLNVLSRV